MGLEGAAQAQGRSPKPADRDWWQGYDDDESLDGRS